MKPKNIVTIVLLLFVGASVGYLVVKEVISRKGPGIRTEAKQSTGNTPPDTARESVSEHKVVAYYFHGNFRCPTCRKFEAYTLEALDKGFADVLEKGTLVWQVVNIEEPENEHFVQDYQLATRSVVLVEMADGKQKRWKNLDRIWDLVGDKTAFQQYISEEIRTYMEDGD